MNVVANVVVSNERGLNSHGTKLYTHSNRFPGKLPFQ